MNQGRRVLCVSGDPDVVGHVLSALADAVPEAELAAPDGDQVDDAGVLGRPYHGRRRGEPTGRRC